MTHDELLAAYAAKNGLADCRFDASGIAVFDMGGGLAVFAESHPDQNALLVQTAVAVQGGANRDLAVRLLASNLFHRGQQNPVAAYDDAANEIVLLACLDTRSLGVEDFEMCLGEVIRTAEYWREALDAPPGKTCNASASDVHVPGEFILRG